VGTIRRRPALTRRRKAVGYTQESFAEVLGIDRSTVVRWESGATEPTPAFRPKIADVLGLSVDELDRILTESPDTRIPAETPHSFAVNTARGLTQRSTTLGHSSNGDASAMHAFRTADKTVGGGHLYRTVIDYLHTEVAPQLFGASPSAPGSHLFSSAAALTEMAGWMAHDAGHGTKAGDHFRRSLDLAGVGEDSQLTAHILGSMAHLADHEHQPTEAIALARRGAGTLTAPQPRLQARLLAIQARGHAALRQRQECVQLLTKAEAILGHNAAEAPSPWISHFDEGSLASESARCMRKLGDHQEARRQSERVIALRPSERTRSRAFGQLGLVAAHLAHGEPEEACAVAFTVFDATESLSSYLVVQQLLHLSQLLKPYRDIAAITELLDCLETALPQRLLTYQWLDQAQPASGTEPRTLS